MTAVYVNLTNPGNKLVNLVKADCGDIAEKSELHEMIMKEGKMIMRKTDPADRTSC